MSPLPPKRLDFVTMDANLLDAIDEFADDRSAAIRSVTTLTGSPGAIVHKRCST